MTVIDYAEILKARENVGIPWSSLVTDAVTYPQQLLALLRKSVLLPKDNYKLITAYILIPSAISERIPYLFFYGSSGSGKSVLSKYISKVRGIKITSSSDTYASIRNQLNSARYHLVPDGNNEDQKKSKFRKVERNMMMVLDDIDPRTFSESGDLYRMLKCGYDKDSSLIEISSEKLGKNLTFECFCPKVFNSIYPFHRSYEFKELHRRLITIPTQKIEQLDSKRLTELTESLGGSPDNLIDLNFINFGNLPKIYAQFWDKEQVNCFFAIRDELYLQKLPFTSDQKAISLDLLATGLSCAIWEDEHEALNCLTDYWDWLDKNLKSNQGIQELLASFFENERNQLIGSSAPFRVPVGVVQSQLRAYYERGWILEMPTPKELKFLLGDLGYKLNRGYWLPDQI